MPRPPIQGFWWKSTLAGLATLVLAWLTWLAYLDIPVDRELARIRAEGYPTTLAELNAWYPTPAEARATDLYLQAGRLLQASTTPREGVPLFDPSGLWLQSTQPLPPGSLSAVTRFVEGNSEVLELMVAAAGLEDVRYGVDFTNPAIISELSTIAPLRYLVALELALATNQADAQRFHVACRTILSFCESIQGVPGMASVALAPGIAALGYDAMELGLDRVPLSDTQLRDLAQDVQRLVERSSLVRLVAADRVLIMQHLRSEQPLPHGSNVLRLGWRLAGLQHLDLLSTLRMYRNRMELAATGPLVEANLKATASHVDRLHRITSDIARSTTESLEPIASAQARGAAVLAALGVQRFRLANGRDPGALGELVSLYLDAVPADVFAPAGTPLRMVVMADRVVVYSVGADGADDGGTPPLGDPATGSDITFTLPRTPPAAPSPVR